MSGIKKIIGMFIPDSLMSKYVQYKRNRRWKNKSTQEVFTSIYESNVWKGQDSVSGRGSDDDQTKAISLAIPHIVAQLKIQSMLDIPCGDFHWMKNVDLKNVNYTGADIVEDLVRKNNASFRSDGIEFQHLNLIAGPLPKFDLIFCRDCLVHFSFSDIKGALSSIAKSGSTYLATTSFNARETNEDIVTGNWRPLNLRKAPFNFPAPLMEIDEKCTEGNNQFSDKTMSVWKIEDIIKSI
jgi:2-polyprenyl-3-methyl-5-hydroxy-6-metoxy-1,4-benzoquinol methylase